MTVKPQLPLLYHDLRHALDIRDRSRTMGLERTDKTLSTDVEMITAAQPHR